eukprot:629977-Pelagomonas_calceolata.AAC.4
MSPSPQNGSKEQKGLEGSWRVTGSTKLRNSDEKYFFVFIAWATNFNEFVGSLYKMGMKFTSKISCMLVIKA